MERDLNLCLVVNIYQKRDVVMNKLTLSTLALLMTLGLAACSSEENEGMDLEQAGDNADDMMEDAGESVGNAAENTKEVLKEAGEDVGEATEDAADSVDDTYNNATE